MSEDMSGPAYGESQDRHPSAREAVLAYLVGRRGQWVPGPDLRIVGGTEATRRVRELRRWLNDEERGDIECKLVDGVWSYRLTLKRQPVTA